MKRAITTFHAAGGLTVVEGSLFDDAEPIVRQFPDLFEDADAAALRLMEQPPVFRATVAPAVEQATAAPGEKRSTKRP